MNASMKAQQPGPAEIYDRFFVPALFRHWAPVVADAAEVQPNQKVLDLACGTGVLACELADRLPGCELLGADPSDEMLNVARGKNAAIQWCNARAESLPFKDGAFDAVVSQFGFMFFDEPVTALKEIIRVLRPEGRLTIAVCDAIDHSPGYAVLAELLHRLFGVSVSDAFRAPFRCGDKAHLEALCAQAGIYNARVTRHDGNVQFPSIASLVSTERACAWTLGGILNDDQFDQLLMAAEESLQPFVNSDDQVCFNMPALIITAGRE